MSKAGRPYERVVAAVIGAFDSRAKVSQGKWVVGPDGRRELDVLVEGSAGDKRVKGIVECKDFNPRATGPVGIAYVDALDSKRRDLSADFALLCSNAGFTADAVRKATRVGIGLIGVMRQHDRRLRFAIVEEVYTRRIRVESMSLALTGPAPIQLTDVPFYDVLWNGLPVANWIHSRIMVLLGANPIVSGTFVASHTLLQPLTFEWANGNAQVTALTFSFTVRGGWYAHRVELDATTGLYDWISRRVRLAPGGGQLQYRGIDFQSGEPIARPPEREFLREKFRQGEAEMKFLMIEGFEIPEPVPDLARHIRPEDLDPFIKDLTPETTTSVPSEATPDG